VVIDRFGHPMRAEIVAKKASRGARKMREVFTTSGYAIVDDAVKLSTPSGLASLNELSRHLLRGDRILVETLQSPCEVPEIRDADVARSPGSLGIDSASVIDVLARVERKFAVDKQAAIPRVCFPHVPVLLGRLGKRVRSALRCDVDNKSYPCEILVVADGQSETQLLSITEFSEDAATTLEVSHDSKAVVVDILIWC
jgi:hypothetical protein